MDGGSNSDTSCAHYVSRMSTAVLGGAEMPELIAHDHQAYVRIATEHALRIRDLRNNREYWRKQLQSSPVGDPLDLMHHLEDSFSQIHNKNLTRD